MASRPVIPQPSLIQIRPQYAGDDRDQAENVLWFKGVFTAPLGVDQLTTIAEQFDSFMATLFPTYGGTNGSYIGSVTTDFSTVSGLEYDSVGTITPVPGTISVASAAQVAALASHSVALRYRGGHGRTYFPYVAQGALLSSTKLTTTVHGNLNNAWNSLIGAMATIAGSAGGPYEFVVFRYKTGFSPVIVGPVLPELLPVTSSVVSQVLATQRRRLRRAAHH